MVTPFSLRTLSHDNILHHLPALNDILASCVNGGASVSFMLSFSAYMVTIFRQHTADNMAAGERTVPAALDAGERPVGTVQLIACQPENQPHHTDVAGLLVHQNARRQGTVNALMSELEHVARQEGKTVLVLDTAAGSGAEQFYVRCDWEKVGETPCYVLTPDGEMTATSLFYKFLPRRLLLQNVSTKTGFHRQKNSVTYWTNYSGCITTIGGNLLWKH